MSSTFSVSGLASGLDTDGLISKMMAIEKKPLTQLKSDQTALNKKLPMLQTINASLLELKTMASDLTYETPFKSKTVSSSSSTVATGSINGANASKGTYVIDSVTKIATSTYTTAQSSAGRLATTDMKISDAIQKSVTNGSFKINNYDFFIDPTNDSLQNVINNINAASGTTGVSASYDDNTGKLTLKNTSSGNKNAIVIGSGDDTSNFLTAAGLTGSFQDTSSGTTTVSSSSNIGALDKTKTLGELKFDKAFTGGKIKINGVDISLESTDTLSQALDKITNSNAGVTASYDESTDKIKFTSKNTGASYINFGESLNGSNFLELVGAVGIKSSSAISKQGTTIGLTDSISNTNLKNAVSGSGIFTINHGGSNYSVSYNSSNTVQEVINSINSSGAGVTANYDSISGKFSIKPNSNTDPNVVLNDSQSGTGSLITALNLNNTGSNQLIGENAEYKINGITYQSNSNTITDKFTDVSFTLNAASSSSVSLTVTGDTSAVKKSIEDFVKKYNEVLTDLNKKVNDESGPLYKDSTVRDMIDGMRNIVNTYISSNSSIKGLGDIGITTGDFGMTFTSDYIGKLQIDSTKLADALSNNSDEVRKLFAFDTNGSNNYTDGVAYKFKNYFDSLTKVDGTINNVIKVQNKELDRVTQNITDWESRMTLLEENLKSQFAAMETQMSTLKNQSQSLTASLNQLSSS
ncbi:MAG: flagellar filament capping protein FliD [Candidatus Wallbacteria bacterium]